MVSIVASLVILVVINEVVVVDAKTPVPSAVQLLTEAPSATPVRIEVKSSPILAEIINLSARPSTSPYPSVMPSSAPSIKPSLSPSSNPTPLPSVAPSDVPSINPTNGPSDSPSDVPSNVPSTSPSASPTLSPSSTPSEKPSFLPSRLPSSDPTQSPSSAPSKAPSEFPSLGPSTTPSSAPSWNPSDLPSFSPSQGPSVNGSLPPSTSPSNAPSQIPSDIPSMKPSVIPSSTPSDLPSSSQSPSLLPSMSPSSMPSDAPSVGEREFLSLQITTVETLEPDLLMDTPTTEIFEATAKSFITQNLQEIHSFAVTIYSVEVFHQEITSTRSLTIGMRITGGVLPGNPPDTFSFTDAVRYGFDTNLDEFLIQLNAASDFFHDGIPSDAPSLSPSTSPSSRPSPMPSSVPSVVPTAVPSSSPSSIPTQLPSFIPSQAPSSIPSQSPSSSPSLAPSKNPSLIPTTSPSSLPSMNPSDFPSTKPTMVPSTVLSDHPSQLPSVVPSQTPSVDPTAGAKEFQTRQDVIVKTAAEMTVNETMDNTIIEIFQETAEIFISDNLPKDEDSISISGISVKVTSSQPFMLSSLVVEMNVTGNVLPGDPPDTFSFADTIRLVFDKNIESFQKRLSDASNFFNTESGQQSPDPITNEDSPREAVSDGGMSGIAILVTTLVSSICVVVVLFLLWSTRRRCRKNGEDEEDNDEWSASVSMSSVMQSVIRVPSRLSVMEYSESDAEPDNQMLGLGSNDDDSFSNGKNRPASPVIFPAKPQY